MTVLPNIDKILRSATEAGDLPGVVALAATREGPAYQGAMVKKWGLGFMINTERLPGGRSAGSLAWAGLGNTYFWIDPAKHIAGVILMQLVPFADAKALELYDRFEKAVYAELA
jgi:CubicO group peptidase (beta-lactamase class C family)